jgi:ComF family protein
MYDGHVKTLIGRLKFDRAKAAAKDLARLLRPLAPTDADLVVTHLPTAPDRARQRGYDQAALLAAELARLLGVRHYTLLRRGGAQRQLGQSRTVRKQQMHQAFWTISDKNIKNRQILLVDDVLTTGATCEAAAAVLKASGAKRVSVTVCAVA